MVRCATAFPNRQAKAKLGSVAVRLGTSSVCATYHSTSIGESSALTSDCEPRCELYMRLKAGARICVSEFRQFAG
jgi:hypothetical protein